MFNFNTTTDYINQIMNKSKYKELFDSLNFVFFKSTFKNPVSTSIRNYIYAATDKEVDGYMHIIKY